jgi:hypothetical protein
MGHPANGLKIDNLVITQKEAMAETPELNLADSLSKRFDQYKELIEGIVLRGIEHPACELKRALTLGRDNLGDRLDFLKLLQGQANAHLSGERLIVIGADQSEKAFYNVENASEFDPARLSPKLAKYLEPEPRYEVFNKMQAPGGETYVLIVLAALQPRPIVILTEGAHLGKPYLRTGEIWIKKNTALQPASKADIDLMYELKIDQEAEIRARRRFEHFREELGPALLSQAVVATPVPELLIGGRDRLARFIEAMISNGETSRFSMLLEMGRVKIVEGWEAIEDKDWKLFKTLEERNEAHTIFYKDEFIPTLQSIVDIGLLIIKYNGLTDWLGSVVDLLVETFEMCGKSVMLARQSYEQSPGLPAARAAYEVYLAVRALAIFTFARKRGKFLPKILPRFVERITPDNYHRSFTPILLFPFHGDLGLPNISEGSNETYWSERIGRAWGSFFASKEMFLNAAFELELILEMNSFLFLNFDGPLLDKYREEHPDRRFAYAPDFWRNPINPALQLAEDIFDSLHDKGEFPAELAVEPDIAKAVFSGMAQDDRIEFLGEFLQELKRWQGNVMMQRQRFPYLLEWGGKLKRAVDMYKTKKPEKANRRGM